MDLTSPYFELAILCQKMPMYIFLVFFKLNIFIRFTLPIGVAMQNLVDSGYCDLVSTEQKQSSEA